MIDPKQFSNALTERFGLDVEASASRTHEGQQIVIRPRGIEHTISFQIKLLLGWRVIKADFVPGNFAAGLMASMNSATPEQKSAFSVFAGSLKKKGAEIKLELDNIEADACSPFDWPEKWTKMQIGMKKVGVVLEKKSGYDFDAAFPWATGFFGMTLSLLPMEKVEDEAIEHEEEGARYERIVKRYERSRINRAACIEINGDSCMVCGFNFGDFYGSFGEGFIHVHHIVPVSEMTESYVLNPGKDLMPVCPNCHAMLHKKGNVLSPDELRSIIRDKN